jgi:hypothetical protein
MEGNLPDSATDRQRLVLRRTKLMCLEDVVAKYDNMAMITAQYPLRSIVDIRVERVAEWAIPIAAIVFFGASGWAAWNYIPNPLREYGRHLDLRGDLHLLCIRNPGHQDRHRNQTRNGPLHCAEPIDEVRGFAIAVKLRTAVETLAGRWRSDDGTTMVLIEFESGPIEGLYKQIAQTGESTVREFGHWYRNGNSLQMLIMATDIALNPRFGIDTTYEIEFFDVDHLRINGPDRENLNLARTSMELTGFEDVAERRATEANEPHPSEDAPLTNSASESPVSTTLSQS